MPSGYLLDTNIISYLIEGNSPGLLRRISTIEDRHLYISSITWYELQFGILRGLLRAPQSKRLLAIQDRLTKWSCNLNILPFNSQDALAAAKFNVWLQRHGRVLQQPDLLIAAQSISNNLVLISHDQKAFQEIRYEGFVWLDWCD